MSEVKRFRHSKLRVEDIERIVSLQAGNMSTKIIKKETGFSETVIQNINRFLNKICNEEELEEPLSKAMQDYCDKHGYDVKYKSGIDPTSRRHKKKEPIQLKMQIKEKDEDEDQFFTFFNDTRLDNAIKTYFLILKNTIRLFKESGICNMTHELEIETVKAAKDIAFKYLSMETEIARAKEA